MVALRGPSHCSCSVTSTSRNICLHWRIPDCTTSPGFCRSWPTSIIECGSWILLWWAFGATSALTSLAWWRWFNFIIITYRIFDINAVYLLTSCISTLILELTNPSTVWSKLPGTSAEIDLHQPGCATRSCLRWWILILSCHIWADDTAFSLQL